MIKKTIKYTNFADETVTDDFEFHISKAEFAKMELSAEGNSMTEYLKRISRANSGREIIEIMEMVVDKAFGVRTLDGKGFSHDPKHLAAFKECGAYDALFEELLISDNAAEISAAFVRGLLPADMAAQVPEDLDEVRKVAMGETTVPAGVRQPQDRQPKAAPEPAYSAPKPVVFEGEVVDTPESIEELEARLEAARSKINPT